jgi:hypothetical protein
MKYDPNIVTPTDGTNNDNEAIDNLPDEQPEKGSEGV